jgi:hypothetical protein
MKGRIVAEFSDYDGLLVALRARVNEFAINGERFDEFAGLPKGYLSKLIGARPVRRIGLTSMGPLFDALGIRCVMIENPVALARLKSRLKPRNPSFVRSGLRIVLTNRFLQSNGRKGGQARWQQLTPQQRSIIMRTLAQRRWGR